MDYGLWTMDYGLWTMDYMDSMDGMDYGRDGLYSLRAYTGIMYFQFELSGLSLLSIVHTVHTVHIVHSP
jgi:hypothetical protein